MRSQDLEIPWAILHPDNPKEDLPLAKWWTAATITACFPVFVFVLQRVVGWLYRPGPKILPSGTPPPKDAVSAARDAAWITLVSSINNLLQTLFSLYLFIGISLGIYNNWAETGVSLVCDKDIVLLRGIDYWAWMFYVSKYWEMFDTVLLIFRGKSVIPPENVTMLLHVYHHTVTATCAWTAWQVPFSVNWTGILANSFVHVCMYFYYFLTDLKLINPLWGGRIITPIQLVQFFLCVGSSYYALAFGHIEECNFHMVGGIYILGNYIIFLSLFLKVWYNKRQYRRAQRQKAIATGPKTTPSGKGPADKKRQ
ncbi:GNS1/SUR4 family [Pelomyxa schiedti]|nr:GNS1/SUR4 family [Pelomyxa schiedti]